MTVREKIEKGFELANYLVLTLLITAQCTVGSNFFVGQFIYFSANVLAVVRCFVLKRPMADKVKDFCMLGITTGLILIKFLGGIRSQKGENKMRYVYTIIRSYAFDENDNKDFEAKTKEEIKDILDHEFSFEDLDFWFSKHKETSILTEDCD